MSFKNRFILAFILAQAFFIFIALYINFTSFNKRFNKYITNEVNSISVLLKESLKQPLSNFDLASIDAILETSKNIATLESLEVFNLNNHLLATNKKNKKIKNNEFILNKIIRKDLDNQKYILYRVEISKDVNKYGYVNMLYNVTADYKEFEEEKIHMYLLILLEVLILSSIILLLIRNFTLKLSILSNSASKIVSMTNETIPFSKDKDEIGAFARTLGNMKDQLRRKNRKLIIYEKMFSHTEEAIIITDNRGQIFDVNDAFTKLTGFERKDVLGNMPTYLKTNRYKKRFNKSLLKELKKTGSWNGEVVNKKKNGQIYLSLINISSIRDDKGKVINYVIIVSDISELKEKENLFQAQAKMATLGEMLGNIAHQWRQPLSSISSTASGAIIQNEMDLLSKEEINKNFSSIIQTSKYLSNTIDDFRNFFNKEKQISKFNVKNAIRSTINIIKAVLDKNDISIHMNVSDEIEIATYENELIQTLINILNNAKDILTTKDYKRYIKIEVIEKVNTIEIVIQDNAGGIPNNIIEKIFEPYFTTKHKSQGTGIGLYMTHIIVNEHLKGVIKVSNETFEIGDEKYKGACFSISLPLSIV